MRRALPACSVLIVVGIPALVSTLALGWLGCSPFPVFPGYVSMTPRAAKKVDVTGEMGGMYFAEGGMGGVQIGVEPHVGHGLSIPIGIVGGIGGHGIGTVGGGAMRLGVRYRIQGWASIGSGLGGGVYGYTEPSGDDFRMVSDNPYWAMHVDLELGVGHEWKRAGFSIVVRPTVEPFRQLFLVPVESVLAIKTGENGAFTVHCFWGPYIDMEYLSEVDWWVGGAMGFMLHL